MLPRNTLTLAEEVVLARAAELGLPAPVEAAQGDVEDWVIALAGSRMAPKLICPETAALLGRFRKPTTIIEAVARHAKETGQSTDDIIDETYPLFSELAGAGILVADGGEQHSRALVAGQDLGICRVVDVVQELRDVGVYRVTLSSPQEHVAAALKISRQPKQPDSFANELATMVRLDGYPAPRILGHGEQEGHGYLLLEWLEGVGLREAGEELRSVGWIDRRKRQIGLLVALVTAYATVHSRGVLHGDIHPGNVLVDRRGRVGILDFGLSSPIGSEARFSGGVTRYFAPEIAQALRDPSSRPALTPVAEQYSVATLCFEIITGHPTHDFSLMEEELLRQLAEEEPLTFSELSIEPWPELERTLRKALCKDPAQRFDSLVTFGEALLGLAGSAPSPAPFAPPARSFEARREILGRLARDGDLYRAGKCEAPTASLGFGAAGIAWVLRRLAVLEEDPALAAAAVTWSARALGLCDTPCGLATPDEPLAETSRVRSVLHGRSGVYAVAAFVHQMVFRSRDPWEGALVDCVAHSFSEEGDVDLDFALGAPGLLALCASYDSAFDASALRAHADELAARVWEAAQRRCFGPDPTVKFIGLAHGWTGVLQGLLRWSARGTGAVPLGHIEAALDRVARLSVPLGRGARWPIELGGTGHVSGWCHGAAGMVGLWLTAYDQLHDERWLRLAIDAGFQIADAPAADGTLCCGRAGQALALLSLFRVTGERDWLTRADHLASTSFELPLPRAEYYASVMKGKTGMLLAACEVARAQTGPVRELCFPEFMA